MSAPRTSRVPVGCLACRAELLHAAGKFPRTIAEAVILGIVASPEAGLCAHHANIPNDGEKPIADVRELAPVIGSPVMTRVNASDDKDA